MSDEGGAYAHVFAVEGRPERTVQLDDAAALKAFYDPVRQRIVRHLTEARSVKELADALGEAPNRLYYHVRVLEQHGFIEVAEERRAGSNVERRYRLAATRFEVPVELWGAGISLARGPIAEELAEIFAAVHRRVMNSVPSDPEAGVDLGIPKVRVWAGKLTRERATRLADDLAAAVDRVLGPDAKSRATKRNAIDVTTLVVVTPGEEGDT